jgi:hypothetical protein
MTSDFTFPIDGKISLTSEPHPYRVPKPAAKPRTPRKAVLAQQERVRQLNAQGHIAVVGRTGVSVFRRVDA